MQDHAQMKTPPDNRGLALVSTTNEVPPGFAAPVVTARGGKGGMSRRSEDAHVQYWTGSDIPVEINSERLLIAYAIWAREAKNGVPRLSAMIASGASAATNDAMLYLKMKDDYLVVSQGADHIRNVGRDMRGKLLSEFKSPVSLVLKDLYGECLQNSEPMYARFISGLAASSYWEGLFVPLKGDDGDESKFVMSCTTPIDNKADILQMILDRSPIGMIAAVPLGNDKGGVDGRIVSINARAKAILKFDEKGSRVHYIRELAPWFRDKTGWTRTSVAHQGQKTWFRYRDNKLNRDYAVTMEPLKRFVLFCVAEIGTAEGDRVAGPPS
jgi:hypothetical protein